MNVRRALLAYLVLGIVILPLPAMAQVASRALAPDELDRLVAPIALYPDPLVDQVLSASRYPLDVVCAARFVKDHPALAGDQLERALRRYTWHDSVNALVRTPRVLTMMNEQLDWLQDLGDALWSQPHDVMNAIERRRSGAPAPTGVHGPPGPDIPDGRRS